MSILFQTDETIYKTFTYTELDYMLLQLNSYNQYYQSGNDDIVFIRISQNSLIIIDLGFNTNIKLFETYSSQYSNENICKTTLNNNNAAIDYDMNDA